MKLSFIPPSLELPVAWTLDLSFPILTKILFNLDGIDISWEDERSLRELRKKRLLYLSNHPSELEPVIAYYVANQIGTRFNFMASRNVFNWGYGVVGEIIKRIGVFSILPGSPDRDAIKMARKILSETEGKLVMYPEGMTSGENDNLVSFQTDMAQLAFWGLEDAIKKDPTADLFIQPTFVKYKISGSKQSILKEIDSSMSRLEKKLRIFPGGRTLLRRFLTLGRVLLEETEFELGIPKSEIEGKDFDYRLGRARHVALNQAGNILNVQFQDTDFAIQKIRELFIAIDSLESGVPLPNTPKEMSEQSLKRAKQLIETAYTFTISKPKNLIQYPTAERLYEWISSFEKHVFGKSEDRARKAHVLIAPAFSLAPYYRTYLANKKDGIASLTLDVKKQMDSLLEKGKNLTEPIVPPYSVGLDINIT